MSNVTKILKKLDAIELRIDALSNQQQAMKTELIEVIESAGFEFELQQSAEIEAGDIVLEVNGKPDSKTVVKNHPLEDIELLDYETIEGYKDDLERFKRFPKVFAKVMLLRNKGYSMRNIVYSNRDALKRVCGGLSSAYNAINAAKRDDYVIIEGGHYVMTQKYIQEFGL